MNKFRRKEINNVIIALRAVDINQKENLSDALSPIMDDIEQIRDDEEEYMDNIPENLQGSSRYDDAQEAVDNLSEAYDSLYDAIESISEDNYGEVADLIDTALDDLQQATA